MGMKKPTGTSDFYPEEMEIRNKIFNSIRTTAKNFGFKEVETPAFESMELLAKKTAEETLTQIFKLEQKGSERYGLRYDLTVPITRLFLEKQKELPKPVKWFGLSRMWRYERPQAGRLREFYQLSVELFGSNKPEADAEIINLAIACLRNLKLTSDDFYVRLNNRKLLQGILEDYTDKTDALISLVDKKDKITDQEFDKSLQELKIKDKDKLKKILETKDIEELEKLGLNEKAKEGLSELKTIIPLITKKFLKLDLTVARGLAYYTGTVFELFDKKGQFRALAGGGRYNNMVEMFDGEPTPATGFGLGYSTLSLLLKDRNLLPESKEGPDFYVAILNPNLTDKALSIINKLRKKYSIDYDIMQRNLKKQLNYANKINAKKIIFIGEQEIWTKTLTIKDLNTGKETKIPIDDL